MNEKLINLFPYTRTRLWVVAVVVVSPYFTAGLGVGGVCFSNWLISCVALVFSSGVLV